MNHIQCLSKIKELRKGCIASIEETRKTTESWFAWNTKQTQLFNQMLQEFDRDFESHKQDVNRYDHALNEHKRKLEEMLRSEKNTLKALRSEEIEDIKTLKDLKDKLNELKKDDHKQCKKVLLLHRNKAQAYKRLTSTVFVYSGATVNGIISCGESRKTFDFDLEKIKQDDITDNLWQILDELSGEDWSDIVNM